MTATDDRVRDLLERLVPPTIETEEWDDILARLEQAETPGERAEPAPQRRSVEPPHRRRRALVLTGLITAAVALALGVTTPWRGGPTLIERASAAIASPSADAVLYQHATFASPRGEAGEVRLWLQTGAPHRFRAIVNAPGQVVDESGTIEIGGTLDDDATRSYHVYTPSDNTLIEWPPEVTEHAYPGIGYPDYDPLNAVRTALAAGTGHVQGTDTIDGRDVVRIVVDVSDYNGYPGRVTYIADAHSYHPIQLIYHDVLGTIPPFIPLFGCKPGSGCRTDPSTYTYTFETYEFLPAIAANLKLTDIQAQHENASTP